MERWSGRPALVTGASVGIGAGIARALVKAGMKVAVCARNLEQLQALKEELKDQSGTVLPIQCDVQDEKQILAMFDVIKKELGGVDVCVNNAGLAKNAPLLTGSTADWKNMMDVNAMGLLICSREAIKSMRERNVDDGHVIQINSMGGHRISPIKDGHFYSATKHAVTVFTEGLRRELREINSHIRITAISPGNVATEFLQRLYESNKEKIHTPNHAIKFLEVQDIAAAAIYALSAPPHAEVHDILIRPVEMKH